MSAITVDGKGVIIPCASCGKRNRTPFTRMNETGVCGNCKAPIPPPAEPFEITSEAQFNALLQSSALPIVIDFWAEWCGPCRAVAPELVKIAEEGRGKFVVGKVNTEQLPQLSARYQVQSIPLMAIFQQGKETTRTAGARPAAAILTFIQQAIGK